MKTAPCKYRLDGNEMCGATWHSKSYHTVKQRKPMLVTKPMNKVGRVSRRTNKAVADWRKTIKPNHQGYYQCHYCTKWVMDVVTEHKKSKVRRPDLRIDPTNFVIACNPCNDKKRSRSHDEFCTVC